VLAVVGVLVLLLGAAAVASATQGRPRPRPSEIVTTSELVGPPAGASDRAEVALVAATGGSQVVRGVTEPSNAVRLGGSGTPRYSGTEPASMTLVRSPGELLVTITPR
jgi:hypothetical protein